MSEKKTKTAIGSMLAQLKETANKSSSAVRPISRHSSNAMFPGDFLSSTKFYDSTNSPIVSVNPKACTPWKYKDRHKSNLGDIESLANDILRNGQVVPGLIREISSPNNDIKYEIIAGERRWKACSLKDLEFKAIIKNVNDQEAAILQAAENLNREDLSDYSKGINYSLLIKEGVFSQSELQERLCMSKASLSELLAYAEIPPTIIEKIDNPSKISPRVASLIRSYCNKSLDYMNIISSLTDHLSKGIGANKFNFLISQAMDKPAPNGLKNLSDKILGLNNEHIFTLNSDGKAIYGISFPKKITSHLNFERVKKVLQDEIERQLKKPPLAVHIWEPELK